MGCCRTGGGGPRPGLGGGHDLEAGRIDWPRAVVIADETCGLADGDAAAVEDRVMLDAAGQTTGQLRAVVRTAMLAIDAAAAIRRRKKAEKQARVETWTETAGTTALAGPDLPPLRDRRWPAPQRPGPVAAPPRRRRHPRPRRPRHRPRLRPDRPPATC